MEEKKEFRRRVTILSALVFVTLCVNYMTGILSEGLAAVGVNAPFWWSTFGMNLVYMVLYASAIPVLVFLIFRTPAREVISVSTGHIGQKALFILAGMGAVILINIVYSVLLSFLSALFQFEIADWSAGLVMPQTNAEWVAYALISTVLPAVLEELVFRGAVLGLLKRKNAAAAVVVSAVLFGFYHGTIEQIPVTLCLGLLLGYYCLRFDSILVPMTFHFANNMLAVVETYLVQVCDEMTSNLIIVSLDFILLTVGVVCVCIIAAKNGFAIPKKEESEEEPRLKTGTALSAAFTSPMLWIVIVYYSLEAVVLNYLYTM